MDEVKKPGPPGEAAKEIATGLAKARLIPKAQAMSKVTATVVDMPAEDEKAITDFVDSINLTLEEIVSETESHLRKSIDLLNQLQRVNNKLPDFAVQCLGKLNGAIVKLHNL